MGDAGGEQGERVEAFALEGFLGLAAAGGQVPHQHHVAGVRLGRLVVAADRGEVEVEEPALRVEDLEVAGHRLARAGERVPLEAAHQGGQRLAGGALAVDAEPVGRGAVEEGDVAFRIEHDHALAERLEHPFEESAFTDEPGDEPLHFPGLDPVEAGDHFFEETGIHA